MDCILIRKPDANLKCRWKFCKLKLFSWALWNNNKTCYPINSFCGYKLEEILYFYHAFCFLKNHLYSSSKYSRLVIYYVIHKFYDHICSSFCVLIPWLLVDYWNAKICLTPLKNNLTINPVFPYPNSFQEKNLLFNLWLNDTVALCHCIWWSVGVAFW